MNGVGDTTTWFYNVVTFYAVSDDRAMVTSNWTLGWQSPVYGISHYRRKRAYYELVISGVIGITIDYIIPLRQERAMARIYEYGAASSPRRLLNACRRIIGSMSATVTQKVTSAVTRLKHCLLRRRFITPRQSLYHAPRH